jgi:hypothetical protein
MQLSALSAKRSPVAIEQAMSLPLWIQPQRKLAQRKWEMLSQAPFDCGRIVNNLALRFGALGAKTFLRDEQLASKYRR